MENIKDYQQYLRGYNYTGITPVIIDSFKNDCQVTFFEDAYNQDDVNEAWQTYKVYCNKK